MKILVACDKFRGSLTAAEANQAILSGLALSPLAPHASAATIPIADGGEGTLEALASADSRIVERSARDPFGSVHNVSFLYDPSRRRAVVEMARVAGHPAAARHGYDPARASSFGVGDLIRAALDEGAREVVVALGGSITVDAGAGALEAMGARFADASGAPLTAPAGPTLGKVASIDLSGLDPRVRDLAIVIAADVDNPLVGPRGAAAVFGPQKGVGADEIAAYDEALGAFERTLAAAAGRSPLGDAPFAGAAGGMMCGLAAIAPTQARDGFALISEHHDLEARVAACDLVVTGEGSLDAQSLGGKGPVGIARMAQASGVPVVGPDQGGPRDLVQTGVNGVLLDPRRYAAEVSPAVDAVLADHERLAAGARATVLGRTWDAICAQLFDHYAAAGARSDSGRVGVGRGGMGRVGVGRGGMGRVRARTIVVDRTDARGVGTSRAPRVVA